LEDKLCVGLSLGLLDGIALDLVEAIGLLEKSITTSFSEKLYVASFVDAMVGAVVLL
jgi:uncharacterized membrane protein YeaQ/YmgE (transglycosylase-associated protein family)